MRRRPLAPHPPALVRAIGAAGSVLALSLLAGCAAAPKSMAPPAAAPAAPAEYAAPPSAGDAQAELDRAEGELARAIGGLTPGAGQPSGDKGANAPDQPSMKEDRSDGAAPAAGDRCEIACRALGSMERATSHLCDLAGDGDDRCSSAKERVASAKERVVAACPACGG